MMAGTTEANQPSVQAAGPHLTGPSLGLLSLGFLSPGPEDERLNRMPEAVL